MVIVPRPAMLNVSPTFPHSSSDRLRASSLNCRMRCALSVTSSSLFFDALDPVDC